MTTSTIMAVLMSGYRLTTESLLATCTGLLVNCISPSKKKIQINYICLNNSLSHTSTLMPYTANIHVNTYTIVILSITTKTIGNILTLLRMFGFAFALCIKVKFNSIKVVLSQLKQELMSLSIHIHLLLAASKKTSLLKNHQEQGKSHWLESAIWGKWICNSQAV